MSAILEPTATAPAIAPGRAQPERPPRWAMMLPALAGGLLLALSVPPAGWWPLGILGMALVGHSLAGRSPRARAVTAFSAGLVLYVVTLFWMAEFNAAGALAVAGLEAAFFGLAGVLTQPGRARAVSWPAAVVACNAARSVVPFGGLPLGGIDLGQAAGPLAPSARLGGPLLLGGLLAVAGLAVEGLVLAASRARRRRLDVTRAWTLIAAIAVTVAVPVIGRAVPDGRVIGSLRIAAVQGGGRRGLRAINNPAGLVYDAQFAAEAGLRPPVDLVLWPENVVALTEADGLLVTSSQAQDLAAEARRLRTTLLVGITEQVGAGSFRNAVVAWAPDGRIVARYDKVHRVPFGEYVPGRTLIRHLVNLDAIPRDAIAGHGSGLMVTPAAPVGVMISFEVFFSDRARSAIRAGGQVLLVPTNTASYTTSQVPDAEIAAARLRSWETGRDIVMAAPTGLSAVLDPRGHVRGRTALTRPRLLLATVSRRTGSTPYLHLGDGPFVAGSLALLLVSWAPVAWNQRTRWVRSLDRPVNTSKP